jgi:uncharacterized protein YggE
VVPSITVCGVASSSVQPDFVVLGLGLTRLAADAGSALDEVAARSRRVAALLAESGLSTVDWVTDGVQVAEEWQWKNDTNTMVGYRATSGVSATVRRADAVGGLLRDAVGDCGASVRNLSWRVDAENPARQALLGDAARDARLRASAYADALGLRLGEVEWVSEMPPAAPHEETAPAQMRMAKAAQADDISVSGGRIDLAAAVYVRFAILA